MKEAPVATTQGEVSIHVSDFNEKEPIGLFEVPLGTVVQVTCRSFRPTEKEQTHKHDFWNHQVEVIAIEGNAINPPIRIHWEDSYGLEKPPLDSHVDIVGYEAGSFQGEPGTNAKHRNLPLRAGLGFGFVSKFVAMQQVESRAIEQKVEE